MMPDNYAPENDPTGTRAFSATKFVRVCRDVIYVTDRHQERRFEAN